VEWSEAAAEQFGYTDTQMLGKGLHGLFRPSDATGFYAEVSALSQGREAAPVEWTFYHGEEGKTEGRFALKFAEDSGLAVTLQRVFSIKVHAETPVAVTAEAPQMEDGYLLPEEPLENPAPSFAKPTPEELSREKVLLGETHHRVKNHLQIITSMLNLQISTLHNEEARDALRSSQNRVRSIAALHQHLYQISIGESGEFATFARSLVGHLRECFEVEEKRVHLEFDLPAKDVPEEWLMPLALSLNEMVSNAFKHAYADGREGNMQVTLTWDDDQGQLCVTDDGGGLPSDFEDHHPSGMGLKILRVFAGQLGGEVQVNAVPGGGAEFKLTFPVEAK
jgi:two-component sensor histidine kinase